MGLVAWWIIEEPALVGASVVAGRFGAGWLVGLIKAFRLERFRKSEALRGPLWPFDEVPKG